LLLQPLVENSIQHGLEPQVAGGRVDISASVQGTQLCLQVQDNGVGLAAPVVDVTDLAGVAGATGVAVLAVQKGATCETGTAGAAGSTDASGRGFGLRQVRERLHTLYGSAGSLQVENQPGGGTCSRIVLPLQA
jgi:sensor histidine kinase YesM